MDFRKLFRVLVLGGSAAGTLAACSGAVANSPPPNPTQAKRITLSDGGTVLEDGGEPPDVKDGKGVEGW